MKRRTFQLLILIGMMTTIFYGCQKDPIMEENAEEENIILFDDPTLLENISPNFYDNHIYKLELLGNNDELCNLISAVSDEGIQMENLNIYGSKKHYFNHSDVIMYSIPYADSEDLIVVYQYDEISQVLAASTEENGDIDRFSMKTSDGALVYSMDVNNKGQFRDVVSSYNPRMEDFSSRVYKQYLSKLSPKEREASKKAVCCRQAEDWSGCMDCTTSAFNRTFYGKLAFLAFGPEVYFAIGISCINAGPNAVC